eukprot:983552_1
MCAAALSSAEDELSVLSCKSDVPRSESPPPTLSRASLHRTPSKRAFFSLTRKRRDPSSDPISEQLLQKDKKKGREESQKEKKKLREGVQKEKNVSPASFTNGEQLFRRPQSPSLNELLAGRPFLRRSSTVPHLLVGNHHTRNVSTPIRPTSLIHRTQSDRVISTSNLSRVERMNSPDHVRNESAPASGLSDTTLKTQVRCSSVMDFNQDTLPGMLPTSEQEKYCAKFHYKEPSAEVQEEFVKLFDVPSSEKLLAHYSCALRRKFLQMGTLYISRQYICFYSTGFWKQAVTIPMGDVVNVSRKRTLKHNAIKFYVNGAGYPKNGYVFTRFWKTADAFDIIKRIVCCPHSLAQAGSVESSSVRESEDDALSVFDAEPYKPGESLPESLDEHFTELDKIEMMEINALDFPVSSDQLFEQCFSQKDGLYAKFLEDGGCSSMNITEWRKCDKYGTCRSQDYTTPIGDMPGFVQNILKTNSTSVTA